MKPIQIAVGFLAGIILGYCVFELRQSPYQFIASQDGQIIWSCNRQTGESKATTSFIPQKSDESFEVWKGSAHDFIFNKRTGEIWRFYQNESNTVPLEGFAPLNFGYPSATPQSTNSN